MRVLSRYEGVALRRISDVTQFVGLSVVLFTIAGLFTGCARDLNDASRPLDANEPEVNEQNGEYLLSTVPPPTNDGPPSPKPEGEEIETEDTEEEQAESVTPTSTVLPEPKGEIEVEDVEEEVEVEFVVTSHCPTYVVSLEERIVESDVIARVQLSSVNAVADIMAQLPYDGNTTKPSAVLEFTFSVLEYLKGTGENELVAVVVELREYDSQAEVQTILPTVTAKRDIRWDSMQAIVFLQDSVGHLPSTLQHGRYFLGEMTLGGLDGYSIASPGYKKWLPVADQSAAFSVRSGNQQLFLLDVPSGSPPPPTISLDTL